MQYVKKKTYAPWNNFKETDFKFAKKKKKKKKVKNMRDFAMTYHCGKVSEIFSYSIL